MPAYQIELKQVVDYPRCRIYREFIQALIKDRSIRTGGSSGLFYYTVLCTYANFRTSYRRLDGITYTVYPGEWVCRITELVNWFRVRFQHQALSILNSLQDRRLIRFLRLGRGGVIKFSISGWRRHNTLLDYNCPCQKESGFFFLPVSTATDLVSMGRVSEMDVILDLWISTVYRDAQVLGSEIGPVVYFRNGTGSPLISYSALADRWGISRSSVSRLLKKLSRLGYLSLMSFSGRSGSVIYLKNYLSTMFQISDVIIDKDEVAMVLNLNVTVPEGTENQEPDNRQFCVPDQLCSVSKSHMHHIIHKVQELLAAQGVPCFTCGKAKYMLSVLSDDCKGTIGPEGRLRYGLDIACGGRCPHYHLELNISMPKKGGCRNERT